MTFSFNTKLLKNSFCFNTDKYFKTNKQKKFSRFRVDNKNNLSISNFHFTREASCQTLLLFTINFRPVCMLILEIYLILIKLHSINGREACAKAFTIFVIYSSYCRRKSAKSKD
ncbi:hypothetical protein BpHYR1_012365 [Brachionus plicatilis]|uniref:Uncharacterized protein n=1 Tax=Brachionus plicatilis TaxID=10195 RepID=A0A3M7S227_BRAPC|nr:hypothetical protein BpHYR1_012365 [Brachionus plicatilis]